MIKRSDIITTPRVKEMRREKKRTQIIRAVIISIIVVAVTAAVVLLFRLQSLLIDRVVVSGTRVIEPSLVESYVLSTMEGAYLFLIPKQNALVYPKRKILRGLTETFPRIAKIEIAKNGFKEINIMITEREGKYLWCGSVFPEPTDTPCYFMDTVGFIFTEAPYFSGTVYFKWYGGNAGENPIGMEAFSSGEISKLTAFIEGVRDLDMKPYAIVSLGGDTYELYIERGGDVGPKIILTTKDDLIKTFENLASAFTTDAFKELIQTKFAGISYIDLRYENKVYYK